MKLITLPDGARINFDNVISYTLSGNTVVFTFVGGSTYTYTPSAGGTGVAYKLVGLLDQFPGNNRPDISNSLNPFNLQISSVSPDPFTAASSTIVVTGSGFTPTNMGAGAKVWIEDTVGGQDSNGTSFTVTYISPTQIGLTFVSVGDNGIDPNGIYLMYLIDAGGKYSNILYLSSPDNLTFTL